MHKVSYHEQHPVHRMSEKHGLLVVLKKKKENTEVHGNTVHPGILHCHFANITKIPNRDIAKFR